MENLQQSGNASHEETNEELHAKAVSGDSKARKKLVMRKRLAQRVKLITEKYRFDLKGQPSIVHYVIAYNHEGPSDFAHSLTRHTLGEIIVTRQHVDGWMTRGGFPKDWITKIHNLYKIPLNVLLC